MLLLAGLILLLPIYNVWQLQMPIRRKLAVIGMFLLGGLVTITGIFRLHFLGAAYASLGRPRFSDVTCKPPLSSLCRFPSLCHEY